MLKSDSNPYIGTSEVSNLKTWKSKKSYKKCLSKIRNGSETAIFFLLLARLFEII